MKMKRRSKRTSKSSRRPRSKPRNDAWSITTIEQFFALPQRTQEILLALPEAASLMREKYLSASAAASAVGISRSTLIRRGGSALKKLDNGRYAAKRNDHLFRPVIVVSENGPVEVATRSFRESSKAGKHSAAVQRYLETGDDSALRRLPRNYIIDAQGNRVALLTDTDELDELGSAGELSFESLYARSR
jgi:predicted DNA-binding protein (UPF0251 family)